MLKIKALKNPSTSKPVIKWSPIKIIIALITNKNKPNVIKVTGMVKKIKTGFRKVFNNPSTKATINADWKSRTWIPGKKCDNTNTTTVLIRSLINKFI